MMHLLPGEAGSGSGSSSSPAPTATPLQAKRFWTWFELMRGAAWLGDRETEEGRFRAACDAYTMVADVASHVVASTESTHAERAFAMDKRKTYADRVAVARAAVTGEEEEEGEVPDLPESHAAHVANMYEIAREMEAEIRTHAITSARQSAGALVLRAAFVREWGVTQDERDHGAAIADVYGKILDLVEDLALRDDDPEWAEFYAGVEPEVEAALESAARVFSV